MSVMLGRIWLLWVSGSRWRFIKAEHPCMKGELQMGRLVIGWQKGEWTK